MNSSEEIKVYFDDKSSPDILGDYLNPLFYNNDNMDIIIVCIGTDKCIGDCLGPMVGTLLKKKKFPYPIYGTLNKPIHAVNIKEEIEKVRKDHPLSYTIAIDACLGETENIGSIQIRNGPIFPGKGVGKKLPSVGDLSIIGVVDSIDSEKGFNLHSIRLAFIMEMAEVIVESLFRSI